MGSSSDCETIYKIVHEQEWLAAKSAGVFHGAAIDLEDGYIHLSSAEQVKETLALHFAGKVGLLLVAVDSKSIATDLVWEPSRKGQLFPHLYGPLPMSAVSREFPLQLNQSGEHIFPDIFS